MAFRLPRLRFILVRVFTISFIIILFLQVFSYFNVDNIPSEDLHHILRFEKNLQEMLPSDDKDLSDDERVKRIKLFNNRLDKEEVNWTRVFLESYKKKSVILNDRDAKTSHKSRFKEELQSSPQKTIEIYEETTVSDILF